ncbi:hypothetical protein J4H24_19275 [Vibrio alginolyticus]|uniref:hypothetical protein n=1 Tax=Vibrio alginolyticus TaxID=663 RepID=UPI001BD27375|nr:hypothetical protein [Vibrio alginolyticus]MBT0031460.1 hypothetical protein [Vibrio alginolyticus]MBT0054405.1 hypothetical protein [Vibrio alginolyticus]
MSNNSLFIRTKLGVANVFGGKTVLPSEDLLLILGARGNLIVAETGEEADALFKQVSKKVKPEKKKCFMLESGGWIHADTVGGAFISPKSGALLMTVINSDNLLAMFTPEEFSDLEGLRDAITEALLTYSEGNDLPMITWSDFK